MCDTIMAIMRTIFLSLLLLSASTILIASGQNQTGNEGGKASTEPQPTLAPASGQAASAHPTHAKDNSPTWYESLKRPEWLIVAAAFLTFGVVGWQAWETRRAVQAARDSANATRKNVEALITSERPWLLVEWGKFGDKVQVPYLLPLENRPDARASNCIFTVRNYGKTPAKVLEQRAELQVSENPTAPPDVDIYKPSFKGPDTYMFPQEQALPMEARLRNVAFVSKIDSDAIKGGGKFLWLCGVIRYEDSFEREDRTSPYETCFCYLWDTRTNAPAPQWRSAGPPTYNHAK